MNRDFILASSSPRRFELLRRLGLSFQNISPSVDESSDERDPMTLVSELSARKATAVAAQNPISVVISADTVVSLDGVILGKPKDDADAARMLALLSGRSHFVYTGVTVAADGKTETSICRTEVFFKHLSPAQIRSYLRTGEPMDKAGAYGIQGKGALLIDHIDGDYFNVVGLPLGMLYEMLKEFEIDIL